MNIQELVVAVYKQRLNDACPGSAESMLKKDADHGEKLEGRAKAYRPVVEAMLTVLEREKILARS